MQTRTIVFLVLFFSTFLHPALSDPERCHPDDKKVLLEIKKAFNDPDIFVSWDPSTDCCDWTSITCSETNRVDGLIVENQDCDLTGAIPPEVGDLPYLQTCGFVDCPGLTGTIPPAITKLKNLEVFGLENTNISGHIPEFFGDFKNLTSLYLRANSFSGPIPSPIGSLPHLLLLDLSSNNLSGQIPKSFESSSPLYLNLTWNKLEGDASLFFASGKNAWIIDISWNLFEFDFSKLDFPENLMYLDISHNRIFGCLPPSLADLWLLFYLDVSCNRLCGEIPAGLTFPAEAYYGNKCLCGDPLPPCNSILKAGFV